MIKKILTTILVTVIFNLSLLYSQSLTFSSVIKDTLSNEALVGVSVWIEGTSMGTTTDNQGFFSLKIDKSISLKLIISSIGYKKKKLKSNQIAAIIYL